MTIMVKKIASVLVFIALIIGFTSVIMLEPNFDECKIKIYLKDENGKPIKDAEVTIWMWYPGEPSTVLTQAKTDENGAIEATTSWRNLLGKWLDRLKNGQHEKVGLIVDIYIPQLNIITTKTILIPITQRNLGRIVRVITINKTNEAKLHIATVHSPNRQIRLKQYTPIVEEFHEHRGRTNLVYVKTDAKTTATMAYGLAKGEATVTRLVVGYDYSDYTSISNPIYSITHSEDKSVDTPVDSSSEGWVSMILTTRFEIIGYYWQDEDGNLVLMYREFRLWAYDFDIDSLAAIKGEDPVWGTYGQRVLKEGTGKGFDPTDYVFCIQRFDFYVNNRRIVEAPISAIVYLALSSILPEFDFSADLLLTIKIVIDHSEWVESSFTCFVWGAEGYEITAYGRYVSVHGTYFMAIDLASALPPPGGGPWIPTANL